MLKRKGRGKETKLCYAGHVLMENRNGLIVDIELTQATGTAEREAALSMLDRLERKGKAGSPWEQTKPTTRGSSSLDCASAR